MIPIIDQNRSLPLALRVWGVTPATLISIAAVGLSFDTAGLLCGSNSTNDL